MRQTEYETILECIKYGAPALAGNLISAFNVTIERANQLSEFERKQAEETRKQELAKETKEKKVKE